MIYIFSAFLLYRPPARTLKKKEKNGKFLPRFKKIDILGISPAVFNTDIKLMWSCKNLTITPLTFTTVSADNVEDRFQVTYPGLSRRYTLIEIAGPVMLGWSGEQCGWTPSVWLVLSGSPLRFYAGRFKCWPPTINRCWQLPAVGADNSSAKRGNE